MEGSTQQTMPLYQDQASTHYPTQDHASTHYRTNLPAHSDLQQDQSALQSVGDPAVKPGYSETAGFDAGQGDASRPSTPEATNTGSRLAAKDQEGTARPTGASDGVQESWLTQLIGKAIYVHSTCCLQMLVIP